MSIRIDRSTARSISPPTRRSRSVVRFAANIEAVRRIRPMINLPPGLSTARTRIALGTLLAALNLLAAPVSAAPRAADAALRIDDASLPSHAKRGSGLIVGLDRAKLASPRIALPLDDGNVRTASRRHVALGSRGDTTWVGEFLDTPGSTLILSDRGGVLAGFAIHGERVFEITSDARGHTRLYEVDPSRLPAFEPDALPSIDVGYDDPAALMESTAATTGTATVSQTIDLMVVYTTKAKNKYGQAQLESMIASAVESANQAYRNSAIAQQLRLVYLAEVKYTESGDAKKSLAALQSTNDGVMDEVHRWRDSYGADLVMLISEDTNYCGYANIMTGESTTFAAKAFSVVRDQCLSYESLPHELGHLQGNNHNRENANQYVVAPYAYGFRRCVSDGTGFRTVMSYSCSGAARVLYFSNPKVSYKGYPTGIAYESDPGHSADTARSMNATADTVAAFRAGSSSPASPSPVPAAPSNLAAKVVSGSRIDLTWTDGSSNEAGFRIERSTNGVDFVEIATVATDVKSFSSTGLAASTAYWYRVRAYNSSGTSAWSNVVSAKTLMPKPTAPANVAVGAPSSTQAKVTWTDRSSNEQGFEIGRQTWNATKSTWSSTSIVGKVGAGKTVFYQTVTPGKYRYRVRAYNAGGKSSWATSSSITYK
jgi:peptidyl-Asp metalloendopeptidase